MPTIHELLRFFSSTAQLSQAEARSLVWFQFFQEVLHKGVYFFLAIIIYQSAIQFRPAFIGNLADFQVGMLAVTSFFIIQRLVVFLTTIGLAQVLKEWHSDSIWIVASLTRLVVFCSLYVVNYHWGFLVLAAVAEGVHAVLFWTQFVPTVKQKKLELQPEKVFAKENSTIQFLAELLIVLAPSLVGFFAFNYGLQMILLIGVILTLFSSFALLDFSVQIKREPISWLGWKKNLVSQLSWKKTLGEFGEYLNHSLFLLWPLYVYLLLKSVDRVGFLYTISLFIAILASFFIGTYLMKMQKKRHYYLSASLMSLLWLARASTLGISGIMFVDAAERLLSRLHWQLHHALKLRVERKHHYALEMYNQVSLSLAAVVFWLLVAAIALFTSFWPVVFIFAAVGVMVSMVIQTSNDKKIFQGFRT